MEVILTAQTTRRKTHEILMHFVRSVGLTEGLSPYLSEYKSMSMVTSKSYVSGMTITFTYDFSEMPISDAEGYAIANQLSTLLRIDGFSLDNVYLK